VSIPKAPQANGKTQDCTSPILYLGIFNNVILEALTKTSFVSFPMH